MTFQDPEDEVRAYNQERARRAREAEAGSLMGARTVNPEAAAAGQRAAARLGLPPIMAADPSIVQDARADSDSELLQSAPRTTAFMARPENAAVAHDQVESLTGLERMLGRSYGQIWNDNLAPFRVIGRAAQASGAANILRGIGERAGTLAGEAARFEATISTGILDTVEGLGVSRGITDFMTGGQARGVQTGRAERLEGTKLGYVPGTTWEDVKASPLRSIVPFALETGIVSLPDMAAVMLSAPAYVAARTGGIGQARAGNDGRTDATVGDLVAALPSATASALLERLGTRGIIGIGEEVGSAGLSAIPRAVGAAAVREGVTEGAQELVEGLGEGVGTQAGVDPAALGERVLSAAVAGSVFGGTIRTVTAPIQQHYETQARAQDAVADATAFEQVGDMVANSPLLTRAPERMREVLNDMAGPDAQVFIPGEKVVEFFQSNPDLDHWMDEWGIRDQVEQAAAAGTDVTFSQGDYLAMVRPREEAHAAFKPDLRFTIGGMSEREAQERTAANAPPIEEKPLGEVFFHGSSRGDLTVDSIETDGRGGTKQGKRGQVFGGLYVTAERSEAERYSTSGPGQATVYNVELNPDAKILDLTRDGQVERLTPEQIAEWRAAGYAAVRGKNIIGTRTEIAIIDKTQVRRFTPQTPPTDPVMAIFDDAIAKLREQMPEAQAAQRVYDTVFSQLREAGTTIDEATHQATVAMVGARTRAARSPDAYANAWEAHQAEPLDIRRAVPETVRSRMGRADVFLEALRRGRAGPTQRRMLGRSLNEFISAEGGVVDTGGDLRSMGLDGWHKGKPGVRRLLRENDDKGVHGVDYVLTRAIEAGYLREDATVDDLTAAMGAEMSGRPTYSQGYERDLAGEDNAAALNDFEETLASMGVDLSTETNAEVKAKLERLAAAGDLRAGPETLTDAVVGDITSQDQFDEINDTDGTTRVTATADEIAAIRGVGYEISDTGIMPPRTVDMLRKERSYRNGGAVRPDAAGGATLNQGGVDTSSEAFKAWFGDSKVVDAEGRPLRVYHGTGSDFDVFDTTGGTSSLGGQGAYFSPDPKVARAYSGRQAGGAPATVPVYLSIQNPLVIPASKRSFADAIRAVIDKKFRREIERDEWLKAGRQSAYVSPERVALLKAEGYDGIINEGVDEIIVFEPTQIKSVFNRGTFDPADPRILFQIPPEVAAALQYETNLPTDPLFAEAVANTKGAEITPDGLRMSLIRNQKPEQHGATSVRTGVFYLPEGSANARFYSKAGPGTGQYYGGPDRIKGETLLRAPLFVKGATGGKAPQVAFDAVRGKGAYAKLERDVMHVVGGAGHLRREGLLEEAVDKLLTEYEAETDTTYEITENSRQGNQLRYALQENIIAHAVRDAGYDSVIGWSKGKNGASISEVFDLREDAYPTPEGDYSIHRKFNQMAGEGAVNAPLADLDRAKAMEEAGDAPSDIWEETGWGRGDDGRWRFEISDQDAKLNPGALAKSSALAMSGQNTQPLSDVFDHPRLFEAYPVLAQTKTAIMTLPGNASGMVARNESGETIVVIDQETAEKDPAKAAQVLIHEVQHLIQSLEGFAMGASTNPDALRAAGYGEALSEATEPGAAEWEQSQNERRAAFKVYRRSAGEIEARNTEKRRDYTDEERRFFPPNYTRDVQKDKAIVVFDAGGQSLMVAESALRQGGESLDDILSSATADGVKLSVSAPRDGLSVLSMIDTREAGQGEGRGGAIMDRLSAWADREGVRLALTPEAVGNTSKSRLSAFYKRLGFKPNTGRSRDFATRETMIREPVARALNQNDLTGPRGSINLTANRQIITLMRSADKSTFLHEMGHRYLEALVTDGTRAGASEQLTGDLATVLGWLGIEDAADIGVEQHEKWAETFEAYLMTGKAPSLELRGAFQRFKAWLSDIYNGVTRTLPRAALSPEIAEVMDRILATDEEIAAAREEMGLNHDLEVMRGLMTPETFTAYAATVQRAADVADDELLAQTMRAVRREKTAEWNALADEIRPEVTDEVDAMPDIAAITFLTENGQGLSREIVVAMLGNEAGLALLPKRVPPLVRANGLHPDVVAEAAGYPSGHAMLNGLMEHQAERVERQARGEKGSVREARIAERIRERLLENYGDILNDGTIAEEAIAALHNDKRGEVLQTQLSVLGRRVGRAPTPLDIMRGWAARHIGEHPISDAKPHRFLQAERKAANAAMTALAKDDRAETFRQKQIQQVNNLLYSAARKAKDDVDKAVTRMSKLGRKRTIAGIDQDYLDRIHDILRPYDLTKVSAREVQARKALSEWVAEQNDEGVAVAVPAKLLNVSALKHYSDLTVDEIRELNETVAGLAALGRLKQRLMDGREKRLLEDVANESVETADRNLGDKRRSEAMAADEHWTASFREAPAKVESGFVKIQTYFARLQNGFDGPFTRILHTPGEVAYETLTGLRKAFWTPIRAAERAIPDAVRVRWFEPLVDHPFINPNTGQPLQGLIRQDLIGMARHVGAISNFEKLAKGWGMISREADEFDVARARSGFIAWLDARMDPSEWAYVEAWWDAHDQQREAYFENERDLTGIRPIPVEASPFTAGGRTMRGGYAPISYDARFDRNAAARELADENDPFGGVSRVARTNNGSAQDRTGYVGPVNFGMRRAATDAHTQMVRISYGVYVRDSLKFLNHPKVSEVIKRKLGEDAYRNMHDWVAGQVKDSSIPEVGVRGIEALMRGLRSNMMVGMMLLSSTTLMSQIGGLAQSNAVAGAGTVAKGFRMAAALAVKNGPMAPAQFVLGKSAYMRSRLEEGGLDRDIRAAALRSEDAIRPGMLVAGEGVSAKVRGKVALDVATAAKNRLTAAGSWMIGAVDLVGVSGPTWMGVYDNALVQGLDEEAAIRRADAVIVQAQGGARPIDQAPIVRSKNESIKAFTVAFGWANAMYNVQRTNVLDIRDGKNRALAMTSLWWLIFAAPLMDAALSDDWPDLEADDLPEELFAWMARNVLFGIPSGIPVVRDAANTLERKVQGKFAGGAGATAMSKLFETGVQLTDDLWRGGLDTAVNALGGDVEDKEVSKRWPSHIIQGIGMGVGIPGTTQAVRDVNYLTDVAAGDQKPETILDWLNGLARGPRDDQK